MLMVPTPARPVILRSFAAVTLPASEAYWYNESLFLLSGHFTYIFVEKCLSSSVLTIVNVSLASSKVPTDFNVWQFFLKKLD